MPVLISSTEGGCGAGSILGAGACWKCPPACRAAGCIASQKRVQSPTQPCSLQNPAHMAAWLGGGGGAELSLGALLQGGNQIACKTCQCVQRAPLGGIGLVHSPPAWSVMRLASCGTLPVLGANRKHLPPGQIPGT
ncbi:unnamed protein product [Caretta caretta]